jgi:hypothetical protein
VVRVAQQVARDDKPLNPGRALVAMKKRTARWKRSIADSRTCGAVQ